MSLEGHPYFFILFYEYNLFQIRIFIRASESYKKILYHYYMSHSIRVTTPQNVNIDFSLATVGERILAGFLDIIFIVILSSILSLIAVEIENALFGGPTGWIVFIVVTPLFFYTLLLEAFWNGQTLGKRILRIKVIALDGARLTLGSCTQRWVMRIVDVWFSVAGAVPGLLASMFIIISNKGQRIGDTVANTTVITTKKRSSVRNSAFVRLKKSYEPQYPQAAQLRPQDIVTLKEVIRLTTTNRKEINIDAAQHIQKILHITKQEPARDFLIKIVKDYNYYEQLKSEEDHQKS